MCSKFIARYNLRCCDKKAFHSLNWNWNKNVNAKQQTEDEEDENISFFFKAFKKQQNAGR